MVTYATACNPAVLRWARKTRGLSVDKVAEKLKKQPADIRSWEEGESYPAYGQLEKLAYEIYKRPLALFFFPEPPEEPDLKNSFRVLPEFVAGSLEPDTILRLRYAKAMQLALEELTQGNNPSERIIFKDIGLSPASDVKKSAARIREYLGVSIDNQLRWRNSEKALKEWRNAVEAVGIFVFKDSFKQEDISGFCLADSTFPIIYLNNSTTYNRQIFSLIHELSHILLGENGISLGVAFRSFHESGPLALIEVLCNQISGELLVPYGDVSKYFSSAVNDEVFEDLAKRYSVSRDVVLRRFLDAKAISVDRYNEFSSKWREQYRRAGKGGSGHYYNTKIAYLGNKYIKMVIGKVYNGELSISQASDYLGIKASNFSTFEQHVTL